MSSQGQPEIILYDLACTKGVCFSPVVWRIRLMLNYKSIPYKTVFLEFQDIEPTMKSFGLSPNAEGTKYTVPAIQHVPSGKYIMDSPIIAKFLEETYPSPPVQLESPLGDKIRNDARRIAAGPLRNSLLPREIRILSPSAQAFFRTNREAALGHKLEDLLVTSEEEDESWRAVEEGMRANGEMIRTANEEGPFIEGKRPGWADFATVGNMECARVIEEGVFERLYKFPGYREVYDACKPWMERKD